MLQLKLAKIAKELIMKLFIIVFSLVVGYAIFTGNMGGARDAAANYNKLLTSKPVANS